MATGEEYFILDTVQNHGIEIVCFSANVGQGNKTQQRLRHGVVHVQSGFLKIIFIFIIITAFLAGQANKAYLCVRLVCANGK